MWCCHQKYTLNPAGQRVSVGARHKDKKKKNQNKKTEHEILKILAWKYFHEEAEMRKKNQNINRKK